MTQKTIPFKKDDVGTRMIQPIEQGAMKGVNYLISDIYYEWRGLWRFGHREKRYSEPHETKSEFNKCAVCKKHKRKYDVVPKTEVLWKTGC